MRALAFAAALALAACQTDAGTTDRNPDGSSGETHAAFSRTAMDITGDLTITPPLSFARNTAEFRFDKGQVYKTRLEPSPATRPGWASVFEGADPASIRVYTVESEKIPKGAEGLCARTAAIAVANVRDPLGQIFQVAAFSANPFSSTTPDSMVCGIFNFYPY